MPITLPPPRWPAPSGPPPWLPWRVAADGRIAREGGSTQRWEMKRNCSIAPNQLLVFFLSLCAVSLAIGVFFASQGAAFVLGFAGLELGVVGTALLVFARHAGDRESITLVGRRVLVEHTDAGATAQAEFRAEWLMVEPSAGQGSLIKISGQGSSIKVGRFVRPEHRAELASDMRRALRRACLCEPPEHPGTDTQITR